MDPNSNTIPSDANSAEQQKFKLQRRRTFGSFQGSGLGERYFTESKSEIKLEFDEDKDQVLKAQKKVFGSYAGSGLAEHSLEQNNIFPSYPGSLNRSSF